MYYKLMKFVIMSVKVNHCRHLFPFKEISPACYQHKEILPSNFPRLAAGTSVTDWLLKTTKNFREQLYSGQ